MTKYIRIKNGECSFTIIEEFDSIEKAANSSNEGINAEVKIENVKLDFTEAFSLKHLIFINSPKVSKP